MHIASMKDYDLAHASQSELKGLTRSKPKVSSIIFAFIFCSCAAFFLKTKLKSSSKDLKKELPPEKPKTNKGLEVVFNLITVSLAACAIVITAIHFALPHMQFRKSTVPLINRFLISFEQRRDFDFLIGNVNNPKETIATLLDHVTLSGLQRLHFYNHLEQSIFYPYILSPVVDAKSPVEMNWRRTLWEEFYLRIGKQRDPVTAGKIIVEHLRQKIGIDPTDTSLNGIETIWARQMTNVQGFHRIYVATLRSVGIAARLNDLGEAELWTGNEWINAPGLPLMSLVE